jgi:hypothetical protein
MDEYQLIKGITALADDEIKDAALRDQISAKIKDEKKYSFYYEVQLIVRKSLRKGIIKHPVPFKLRKKLVKILESVSDPPGQRRP